MQRSGAPRAQRCPPDGKGGRMRRALPLLLAVAAFFIAGALWIGSRSAANFAFREGSALNTSAAGTSLAFAYLRRGGMVKMFTTPLRNGALPGNAVVFRIDTSDAGDFDEGDDEPGDKKTKAFP